ncbi:hypothetical protein [Paraburkholderia sp. BL21I4N1]|uniref:hypothetical protein n=1 Tax=Paraburkholderia sp. BL21I4N1 TaxID=1938801 RepID=UPI000CFDB343|nr:hypothetical protein [Paraburkholderia sp. BL21I4N1]PQV48131.1 hypothetical protein B0G83_109217 [Paraburkholderia sp. BL21I4N1]
MHTCPLLHASMKSRASAKYGTLLKRAYGQTNPRRWLALSVGLLGWLGWHALRDVLNAIPDSNDDFGLF